MLIDTNVSVAVFNINASIMSKRDQYQCSSVQYQCQHNIKTGSISVSKDLSMLGSVSMLANQYTDWDQHMSVQCQNQEYSLGSISVLNIRKDIWE